MTGLTALFPYSKLFARYYLGHLPENEINQVDVLPGAFMMVDKKVLDTIGSFDERFFMYAEDIDLGYRIQKAGYKNYYYPEITIIHFKGESTQKLSAGYIRNFYGAMILFIKKHYNNALSGLYILFLKSFIAVKSLTVNNAPEKTVPVHFEKAFILADDIIVSQLKQPLQKSFKEILQSERIAFPEHKNDAFIFCASSSLLFKEIIEQLKKHKGQYEFFIHAEGSASIVGSSDKNNSGVALSIN